MLIFIVILIKDNIDKKDKQHKYFLAKRIFIFSLIILQYPQYPK